MAPETTDAAADLVCWCCGNQLGDTFTLVRSVGQWADVVLTVLPEHVARLDMAGKVATLVRRC